MASTTSRTAWTRPLARAGRTESMETREFYLRHDFDQNISGPDPFADEKPWPRWAVTLSVVAASAILWSIIIGLGSAIFALLG